MKTTCTLCILLVSAFLKAQTVTTVTEGLFYDGLCITSNGNVYCSNFIEDQVFKYELATGAVTTFVTGLVNPNGIGVTEDDLIYICEAGAGRISVYNTNGTLEETISGLNNPTGIKYNPNDGHMLWVSYSQSSVNLLNTDTNETTILTQGAPLNGPSGIAFIENDVFISNYNDRKIFRLEADNSLIEIAQLPATATQTNALGFLTSKDGFLFATQIGEHRIYRINRENGEITLFAGSTLGNEDGSLNSATFNFPNGILGDNNNDRLYISDAGSSNLRIIENVNLSVANFEKPPLGLQISTNPVKDIFEVQVTLPFPDTYTLKVYTLLGKLLEERTLKAPTQIFKSQIDSHSWSNGTYIIELRSGRSITTKKVLK